MLFCLACVCGFLLGVSVESLTGLPITFHVFLWIFFVALVARNKTLFFVCFFALGVLRTQAYESSLESSLKQGFQKVEGTIIDELDRRSAYQNVSLLTGQGEVLAKVSLYEPLTFGDEVQLQGDLDLRLDLSDDEASYRNYLGRQGVVALMPEATVRNRIEGPVSFRKSLYSFKSFLEKRLQFLLPEPESSFSAGLLLGSRKGMSPELTRAFQTVGLLHIVAISGSNISLVIATVFSLLSFLKLRSRIFLSVAVLAVFVLLVGASSTVIRAAVMGVLTLVGLYSGRRSMALFGLLWSIAILVFWNPYLFLFDIGFQLSVLSTLGLLVFVPVLEAKCSYLERLPKWAAPFKEAFLLTMAAQIATIPLMLHFFGQTSWVTPFVNVLAAPLIPLAMLASFFTLFCPWFMAPAWFFLIAIEKIAVLGAQLPGASLLFKLSLNGMFFCYVLELVLLLRFYKPILVRAFFRHPSPASCKESNHQFETREKSIECQV